MVEPIFNFPKIGISCFSKELIDRTIKRYPSRILRYFHTDNGDIPIYEITYKEQKIVLYMSRTGAPACTIGYEEIIVMGLEVLILFGTCGVLDGTIDDTSIIIPTVAIIDEGTSKHYEKQDEIDLKQPNCEIFESILQEYNYTYQKGKVWTTDALYRETREKVEQVKNMGCICVDMEASAMASVSMYRKKDLFHFLYAADNLDADNWDERSLGNQSALERKDQIVDIALTFAYTLSK